ncbi:P-loop NTPase fold protein [uncultured Draconibacterium sp.]|uniref:P-loop NTPase fold protein n=1 Tax=uncultured Draconibacterium sp. TaxID=1573823 RepID=UPI0032175AD5
MENKKVFFSIPDNPTSNDKLGFRKFTNQISQKLISISENNTPFTMGIYGEWGAGKTSFLKMIEEDLNSSNVQTVWFNAWKYNKEKDLWASLVQTMIVQSKLNASFFERIFLKINLWIKGVSLSKGFNELIKQLIIIIVRIALLLGIFYLVFKNKSELLSYSELFKNAKFENFEFWSNSLLILLALFIAQPLKLIQFLSKNVNIDFSKLKQQKTFQEHVALIDNFNTEFYELLKIIRKKKPITIFIDDLDRCLPDKAIEVFEAIKLFLDIPGCIFIIALDRNIVEKIVISKHIALLESEKLDSHFDYKENYLDKIIQLSFQIPPLSKEEIKIYISHIINGEIQEKTSLIELFADNLPANPRRIKRIIQLFYFLKHFSEIENNKINELILAKFIIIQNQFRELYDYCSINEKFISYLENFATTIKTSNENEVNHLKDDNIEYFEKAEFFIKENENINLLFNKYGGETFRDIDTSSYIFLLRTFEEIEENKMTDDVKISSNYLNRFNYFSFRRNNVNREIEPIFSNTLLNSINQGLKNSKRILITGGPGTGKTTLGKWILYNSAIRYDNNIKDNRINLPNSLIPIIIQAREINNTNDFEALVRAQFKDVFVNLNLRENISFPYLEKGKSLILVDGLDEMLYETNSSFIAQVMDFINKYPENRYILTSRDFINLEFSNSLSTFEIININETYQQVDIERFVSNYIPDKKLSSQLMNIIDSSSYLKELALNPLLLTTLVEVYTHYGKLPEKSTSLIRSFINLLMEEWDNQRNISRNQVLLASDEKYELLSEIAFHCSISSRMDFDISFLTKSLSNNISKSNSSAFIKFLVNSGLIIEINKGVFSFVHKIFSEYLTADYLMKLNSFSSEITNKFHDSSWSNIWSLTFELTIDLPSYIKYLSEYPSGIEFLRKMVKSNNTNFSDNIIKLINNLDS